MSLVAEKSFTCNTYIMAITGLYPLMCTNMFAYKIYAYIFYTLFTVPVPVLALIFLSVDEKLDLPKFIDNAFLTAQMGILILKLLPFILNSKNVKWTMLMLDSNLFSDHNTDSQAHTIITNSIATSRRIFNIFFACCCASLFCWSTRPLFSSGYHLPIELWMPFDVTANAKSYYPVYLFTVLGVTNGAISNAAADTLISGLIYHATGQLRILKHNLIHLSQHAEAQVLKESGHMSLEAQETLKAKIIYTKIKNCIKHHDAIIQYVNSIENTYSFVVFSQFLASIFVICICCYRIVIIVPFSLEFNERIVYLMTMLAEVFMYCYYGTTLYEESNSLPTAIYMSRWYEFDIKSKKALIILMERAKRPLIITAGKVLDLTLETFMMILRRSYSVYAVLNNY